MAGSSERIELLRLGLGRAAELVVLHMLRAGHSQPTHVSEVSDHYGYDIESSFPETQQWEVKGCFTEAAGRFHISRNEFETCKLFRDSWKIVQVQFAGAAVTAPALTEAHVIGVRQAAAPDVIALAPAESPTFRWEQSAQMTLPASRWTSSAMGGTAGLSLPSLYELGAEAADLRLLRVGRRA
ncbi:DUF3883 domain-containing protein [Plantibacter sp. Leaf314]|uniref:DUF3883 domain-containing protein n=1 Tax=Plantibacter sp. Leaf314 TaxID=1736333 RepID=UPI00351063E5